MHPYVLDALQLVGDMPGRIRRRVTAGEADKVAGSGIAEEAGRTPRQTCKIVGAQIGFRALGNEPGGEYLKTGRVVGQSVTMIQQRLRPAASS